MNIQEKEIIAKADHCLTHGKAGTFGILRVPDGPLWYVAPGVKGHVRLLRVRHREHTWDEKTFDSTLVARLKPKTGERWFVVYDLNNRKMPYIASSVEESSDFFALAIVDVLGASGPDKPPISILVRFYGSDSAIARIQDLEIARALFLDASSMASNLNNYTPPAEENTYSGNHCDLDAGQRERFVPDGTLLF